MAKVKTVKQERHDVVKPVDGFTVYGITKKYWEDNRMNPMGGITVYIDNLCKAFFDKSGIVYFIENAKKFFCEVELYANDRGSNAYFGNKSSLLLKVMIRNNMITLISFEVQVTGEDEKMNVSLEPCLVRVIEVPDIPTRNKQIFQFTDYIVRSTMCHDLYNHGDLNIHTTEIWQRILTKNKGN
jgi:hypothetical protein